MCEMSYLHCVYVDSWESFSFMDTALLRSILSCFINLVIDLGSIDIFAKYSEYYQYTSDFIKFYFK